MTHTKPPHKPFTKKFWILLGSSVLSLLLVYGGIVWAVYFKEAKECKGNLATNCIVVGKKGIMTKGGETMDKRETDFLNPKKVDENGKVKIVNGKLVSDEHSPLYNKQLVITNADPAHNYFIPLRTEAEIVSAYKATLPKGVKGNGINGGLFRKVNICAKGGAAFSGSVTYNNTIMHQSLFVDIPECPSPRLCFEEGRSCNTDDDCRDTAGSKNICKKDIVFNDSCVPLNKGRISIDN